MWVSEFSNWGGDLKENHGLKLKKNNEIISRIPCERSFVPVIFYDGRTGLCACADYEARLIIVDLNSQELSEILLCEKRKKLIISFLKGTPPPFCAECTFYHRDTAIDFWEEKESYHKKSFLHPYILRASRIFKLINQNKT